MTDPSATFDITPFLTQDEGQHFDRKSLFEGPPSKKRSRDRRAVRDQVAEYVAGFANAEGGVLLLGVEDDGALTGHALPEPALRTLLNVPAARLQPPQAPGFVVQYGEHQIVVFDVTSADVPVQVTGDGFPLRIGDRTVQASEQQIRQLKYQGLVESWESRPSRATLDDLDPDLLARARQGAGLSALSDAEYLLKRKMADRRGTGLVLRNAAELVFARYGPDHPNAGVRLFRVVGRERRYGAEHNVEERPRIEGNLPEVIRETMETVGTLLRRPSRLVGTRFQSAPEYPDFSWKEAVLNAIAHRDYGVEGRTTEVWLFDDRMEVASPGSLVPGITLEALNRQDRVHSSRNPRLVRVLVDLGYMRDQGEGIPRMFAEMEGSFLPAPELTAEAAGFRVTLRNTPTLTAADTNFIAAIGDQDLSPEEFRALLEAHRHDKVDNARMRRVTGMDTLGASQLLRGLRDRQLLELHSAGSASFYTLHPNWRTDGGDLTSDGEESTSNAGERGSDGEDLQSDGGDLAPDGEDLVDNSPVTATSQPLHAVRPDLAARIAELGPRPRRATLRPIIRALVADGPLTAAQIAERLGRKNVARLVEKLLTPMVADRELERTHPDVPNHPEQAYRAAPTRPPGPLFASTPDDEEA